MSLIKAKAGPDVAGLIESIQAEHHAMLSECGVTIAADLVARPAEDDRPALVDRGVPIPAIVRRVGVNYRLHGAPDATITLDGNRWARMDNAHRAALIDHCLCQLEVRLTEQGEPVLDAAGRPTLVLKPPDLRISVYDEVIARHGEASCDHQQLKQAAEHLTQLTLPWG